MQLTDVLCYIFLTITFAASCVEANNIPTEIDTSETEKRIRKRETTLIIDNFPFHRDIQKPKTVYRRISKHRYVKPKTKYAPPKHKAVTKSRSPSKKFRGKHPLPKRAVHNIRKQRYPKISYRPSKHRSKPKPAYGPPKALPPYAYFAPVSTGFGEPPVAADYSPQLPLSDRRPYKPSHGEAPMNSYGEPIQPVYELEAYPTAEDIPSPTGHLDNQDFNIRQEYKSWMDFRNEQHGGASSIYTKRQPKPDNSVYVTPVPNNYLDDINNSDTEKEDPISPMLILTKNNNQYAPKKKQAYFVGHSKTVKKPWKVQKKKPEDDIIVGGQYAEPPGRVHRFEPSAAMLDDDEEFAPRQTFDSLPSARHSPYVNYKHSNIAFSPQNLNDAFSIVDK